MKFLTVVDAFKGYHQVLLGEESSVLKTFSVSFNIYQYDLRSLVYAGGYYRRRVTKIFDDLPNRRRIVEDIFVSAKMAVRLEEDNKPCY